MRTSCPSSRLPQSLRPWLFAGALGLFFVPPPTAANELAGVIRQAIRQDPAVLESLAKEDEAEFLIDRSKAQRWPTLGVQAGNTLEHNEEYRPPNERALVGRLSLYDAGTIGAQIDRDQARREFYRFKTEETREQIAYTIGQYYLQALRAKELLAAERLNLARHERILDDLEVVVENDQGRRSELSQAQSRALQVKNRISQYQRIMRLALSRLKRYTGEALQVSNPFSADWQSYLDQTDPFDAHPSLKAQSFELESIRHEIKNLERSLWPKVRLEMKYGRAYGQPQHLIGLMLDWPILDYGSRYYTQSQTKQLEASQSRAAQIHDDIAMRSQTAKLDMEESAAQVQSAGEQITASQNVVDLYTLQFKIARRSLIDLLNAYSELSGMEVTRINAQNDQRTALLDWLHANAQLGVWAQEADLPAD